MRSELSEADLLRVFFYDVPDHPFRHTVAPMFARSTDASKQPSGRKASGGDPSVDGRFDPVGHRHCSNVSALTDEVDDDPMFTEPQREPRAFGGSTEP